MMPTPHQRSMDDTPPEHLSLFNLFVRLKPMVGRYPLRLVGISVFMIGYTLSGRAIPILFGTAVDRGLTEKSVSAIYLVAAALLLVEVLRSAFGFLQRISITRLGNLVLHDIRVKVISHVQRIRLSQLDKMSSGRLLTRVTNDVHSLGEIFNRGVADIAVSLIEMLATFITLMLISPRLTLIVAVMALPMGWLASLLSLKIRESFAETKRKLAHINAHTAESISGIKTIHLYDQNEPVRRTFKEISSEYRDMMIHTMKRMAMLWPLIEAFNVSTTALALLGGAYWRTELQLSPGELASFVLLATSFFRPLRVILENYNFLQNSVASAARVFQTLDLPQEDLGSKHISRPLRGEIEFRNVWFRYSPDSPWVLQNFNLHVRPGEKMALVGRTGSGKSTIAGLIQKLYHIERGEILIDGTPISEIRTHDLRRRISAIQQEPFLFRGTLGENIGLKCPDIFTPNLWRAAEQAHCQELLARGGLNMPITENGSNLSLGEKQLIAFARSLAFAPDILILDEATSNIDSHHEDLIQQTSREVTKGRTSLIIAHRLSTVLDCDRIVLLDQGQILEQGSHQELIKARGPYHHLYTTQKLVQVISPPNACI